MYDEYERLCLWCLKESTTANPFCGPACNNAYNALNKWATEEQIEQSLMRATHFKTIQQEGLL